MVELELLYRLQSLDQRRKEIKKKLKSNQYLKSICLLEEEIAKLKDKLKNKKEESKKLEDEVKEKEFKNSRLEREESDYKEQLYGDENKATPKELEQLYKSGYR